MSGIQVREFLESEILFELASELQVVDIDFATMISKLKIILWTDPHLFKSAYRHICMHVLTPEARIHAINITKLKTSP